MTNKAKMVRLRVSNANRATRKVPKPRLNKPEIPLGRPGQKVTASDVFKNPKGWMK